MKSKHASEPAPTQRRTARFQNVDEYLAVAPEPARAMLAKMRAAIRSALPAEATEVISYQIPAFRLKKVLVWIAAFQKHCSLFPTAAVLEQFKDELKEFKTSKGTVHFPLDKPLPTALIKRMVKARLQNAKGAQSKSK